MSHSLPGPSDVLPVQTRTVTDLGAERIERVIPGVGTLFFENADAGQWLTQKGEPAKKARRVYELDGHELPSVTTILDVLAKPALIAWAEAEGARGAAHGIFAGDIGPHVPEGEVIEHVRRLGLGAGAVKRKAAARGLDIHEALDAWASTGDLPNPADMDPEHRPYLRGLARALLALDPEPICAEVITCSPEYGYAGRFDLLALIDGAVTMVDLKTSKNGRPYAEAHGQLAAYSLAETELTGNAPERLVALGVSPDGGFCADECCATREDWLAVLDCYRAMQNVRAGMAAAAKAAKAAA